MTSDIQYKVELKNRNLNGVQVVAGSNPATPTKSPSSNILSAHALLQRINHISAPQRFDRTGITVISYDIIRNRGY